MVTAALGKLQASAAQRAHGVAWAQGLGAAAAAQIPRSAGDESAHHGRGDTISVYIDSGIDTAGNLKFWQAPLPTGVGRAALWAA
jgi:hypothetical protein